LDQFPDEKLVLLASIPGYPDTNEVEISEGAWVNLKDVVQTVTITLESGASPSVLFPANDPAATAIDHLLPFY
jgi:hypothetical protein